MAKILGIDLGTGISKIAIIEAGQPKMLENREGSLLTPSIVAISKTNERLVGIAAKRQAITNPENTIFSIKRLIGRRFSDPTVQADKKLLPYELRESSDGGVEVKMGGKWLKPPEISAMILQKLKQDAEEKLGEKITDAIITCPAYFDDSQRKATKVAGEIAGFNVKRVINEPTAAALAYGLTKQKGAQIIVYDLGSGTFDISILDVQEDTVKVIATGGDTHLGGDDFDQAIIDLLIKEFKKEQGIDLSKDTLALQRLKEAAEKAKVELSTTFETEINMPFITSDASGPRHLLFKLSRSKFEDMIRADVAKTIDLISKTINEAKLKPADIEEIILVGGPTRIPLVRESVKTFFKKEPHQNINPDEVVAMGAAIEGGILAGDVHDILLLDVTPLSLGIETMGGVDTVLITKNTTVPAAKTQVFSTAADNQTSVEIHVLQGERPMVADNKSLGRFILDGIPPSSRGIPQIEVTFDIDANGILSVTAKDRATNRSQSIKIEGSTGLSKEEIERMTKEAEIHAQEDQKKREASEIKNTADTLIHTAEKALSDAGDKVSADDKKVVEDKIAELRKIKDANDSTEIKAKTEELSKAIQKIGEAMYNQQPQQPENENKDTKGPQEGEYKEKPESPK